MNLLTAAAAVLLSSVAHGQWQPNLRIVYDRCGQRSLEWDPVPGAAAGSVTYRVHRCSAAAPNCGCQDQPSWAANNVAGWSLVGTTNGLAHPDLPSPAASYALSRTGDPMVFFVAGDGRWGGNVDVSLAPVNLLVPPGRSIPVSANVRSATQPTSFRLRRNGVVVAEASSPAFSYEVQPSDHGAVLSMETSNPCESVTTPIGAISFPALPDAPAGFQWLEFERHTQSSSRGSRYVYTSNWCAAPPWCESFLTQGDSSAYQPASELSASTFAWSVNATRFCSGCVGGGTCGSCQPSTLNESATAIRTKALLLHHHVLDLNRSTISGWRLQVWLNGALVYAPGPEGSNPNPPPTNVQLGLGPGVLEVVSWASLALDWPHTACGTTCGAYMNYSCSCGGNVTGTLRSMIRVPQDVPTLRAALDAAPASQPFEIVLAAGVHEGPIALDGRPVSIRGAGIGKTFIQMPTNPPEAPVVRLAGEPSTAFISQLTIRGGMTGGPISPGSTTLVGGAVFASASAASFVDVAFEGNASGYGGAVYALNSSLRFERCSFRGNAAASDGGGVLVFRGSGTFTDCTLEDNGAGSSGGGIHVVGGGPHLLLRTDILGNSSAVHAGGLSWVPFGDPGAALSLRECEVRNNAALLSPGGIRIEPDSGNASLAVQSTIACGNAPTPNIAGPFVDLGGNTLCGCPADLDGDGAIDGNDLGLLLAAWGPCGKAACQADLDRSGAVDGADLGALLNDWVGCP